MSAFEDRLTERPCHSSEFWTGNLIQQRVAPPNQTNIYLRNVFQHFLNRQMRCFSEYNDALSGNYIISPSLPTHVASNRRTIRCRSICFLSQFVRLCDEEVCKTRSCKGFAPWSLRFNLQADRMYKTQWLKSARFDSGRVSAMRMQMGK